MRRPGLTAMFLVPALVAGCSFLDPGDPANCDPRIAFYPDTDGDGVGDSTDIYLGCEAPSGWVDVPPAVDTDTDTLDTDVIDTDPVDTDTDPIDTDTDTDLVETYLGTDG